MPKEITSAHISEVLGYQWESDLPNAVMEVFERHEGKQFTKRILKDLPGGEERWNITHRAGMTNIEDNDYIRSQGAKGYRFFVAYGVKNITIDPNVLLTYNPCHFDAREARNKMRITAKNSEYDIDDLARKMNDVRRARAELAEKEAALNEIVACPYGIFSPDRYRWKELTECKDPEEYVRKVCVEG